MAKTFDATLKGMLEESPGDWPVLAGLPRAEAEVIDADVSTFTGAADKVLQVRGAPDWIMHLEFQSGPDTSLPRRMQTANVLLDQHHGLMVRSVAVLLRPEANLSNLTGVLERRFPGQEAHLTFRYQVIRVWRLPLEPLLSGGLGLLPLAPISAVPEADLPAVVKRIKERLSKPKARSEAARLWTATYLLLGMRYSNAVADQLLEDVMIWEVSTTYQAIIRKGQLAQARKLLLAAGSEKFGSPNAEAVAAVEAIADLPRLESMLRRVFHTSTWEELLEPPTPAPRPRRRKPKA
jgi:hypothetical protein